MNATVKAKLTHCALFVSDMERMLDFYTRFIGLSVTDRGTAKSAEVEMVFLSNDPDEHHQFVLVTGRPENVEFHLNQQFSFLLENLPKRKNPPTSAQPPTAMPGPFISTIPRAT